MNRIRYSLLFVVLLLASGCASQPSPPATLRQALLGLGDKAATRVLESPVLNDKTPQTLSSLVLLLPPSQVDPSLDIDSERFRESLTRGLLAKPPGPQVLDWTAEQSTSVTPSDHDSNQWILESRLETSGAPLQLSDRVLVPYRLTLSLRRPGDARQQWQEQLSGAIDTTAL
ncbi:hypothetical protein [Pistricoccus aurantiacus]|uniref:hypothetical protein n=1 Tax=Pistricoccus aurantiacus TaxID=1883414 RepID=UPI00363A47AC